MTNIDSRFKRGFEMLKSLEQHPRYLGAFIFGSVAEGTANAKSDLDARVVVDQDNLCTNVSHPMVDGYKIDLSFSSFEQIKKATLDDIAKGERRPNLATALVVFDKTGELAKLRTTAQAAKPATYISADYSWAQFMLYHANNKVERYVDDDPESALYSMHANIGEVLKNYYKLNGKWWVSSKKNLADLDQWDKPLAALVRQFVSTSDIKRKYAHWSGIIDHVTTPMGGRQPIEENNCDCGVCSKDLRALIGGAVESGNREL